MRLMLLAIVFINLVIAIVNGAFFIFGEHRAISAFAASFAFAVGAIALITWVEAK